jgi:PhnB protein
MEIMCAKQICEKPQAFLLSGTGDKHPITHYSERLLLEAPHLELRSFHAFPALVGDKGPHCHGRFCRFSLKSAQLMNPKVASIPAGYHSVTPFLVVHDAARAIEFYQQAFGACEIMRFAGPDGKIGHAQIQIGNSMLMLCDECPQRNARGPLSYGGTPGGICLYVEDCDTVFQRAVAHGGKVLYPVQDQFYGDRSGTLTDPYGHLWTVATHKEDLSMEELRKRAAAMCGSK